MCCVQSGLSQKRDRRIKGLRVGVLPSKENLQRLRLFLLDRRKLRGNMTDFHRIREVVNKINTEPPLSRSYSTRNRVYLMKPEGDWLRTGQTVILYHLSSELLGATGGCEDALLPQLQKRIRQIQG